MSSDEQIYWGREQTGVKHVILKRYLLRLAVIVGGTWADTITYIDCFSGPWENNAADYSDTSFGIAIQELKKAKIELNKRDKQPRFRCLFLEKDKAAFAKLEAFCKNESQVEATAQNSLLENAVPEILKFHQHGGQKNFSFTFIDPTGWTGIEMDVIRPLLKQMPGEVLINYMTSFIRRFIESNDQSLAPSFDRLYGDANFRAKLQSIPKGERDDAMVEEYVRRIKSEGEFQFVCYTPIFQPKTNDIHFHLIYCTRHAKGLEVFKKEEREAVKTMEQARAEAQQRNRESGGARELFSPKDMHDTRFYASLRTKYLSMAQSKIRGLLSSKQPVDFDRLWEVALTTPLVWVEDLNQLLLELKKDGKLKFIGLGEREKFPKHGKGVLIQMI
jgi:three-Cys-motif partner protein